MRIEIRLLARLLRIPLLRVEGVVDLRDDDDAAVGSGHAPPLPGGTASTPALGRDLADAEAIVAQLDAADRPPHRRHQA